MGDALAAAHGLKWKTEKKFEAECCRLSVAGQEVWLLKPLTFMNESGRAVSALARFYKLAPAQVAAVYDDITLPVGRVKISVQGGAGGHNGVADLLARLGNGFARYRIGIGAKAHPEMDLKDHVLGTMSTEEETVHQQRLDDYLGGLDKLVREGPEAAMNELNRKQPIE